MTYRAKQLLIGASVLVCLVCVVAIAVRRSSHAVESAVTEETKQESTIAAEKGGRERSPKRRQELEKHWGTGNDCITDGNLEELKHAIVYGSNSEVVQAVASAPILDVEQRIELVNAGLEAIGDPWLRRDLVISVSEVGTKKVLPTLLEALKDEDPFVRSQALYALGQFSNIRDLELEDWLKENLDEGEEIDNELIESELSKIGEDINDEEWEDYSQALLDAFNDSKATVREDAMETMLKLRGDMRLQAMEAALQSDYQEVQMEALRIAEGDRTKQSYDILLLGMESSNDAVADKATFYAGDMVNQNFTDAAEAKQWWSEHSEDYNTQMVQSQESLEK